MRTNVPPPLPSDAQQSSVAATVRALPPGARPSEVWRSAAFLLIRLNANEAEGLAALFEDPQVTDDTRLVILDLLAGAGTFDAQTVMRRLLALAIARQDNRVFATFVQRLAILDEPDGPTLRFLMSVYAESKTEPDEIRAACAYALGAAAGQAFKSGDAEAAVRATDALRRDLLSAGEPLAKASLLTALGNAGLPNDATVLLRFVTDTEPSVRAASALSLRKISTRETRAQLVAMLADAEVRVAQSALVALTDHRLVDEELDRLADLVLGGRTAIALDPAILRLVVKQRPRITTKSSRKSGGLENALRLLLGRAEAEEANKGSGERRALPSGAGPAQAFPEPTRSPSWTKENPVVAAPLPKATSGSYPVVPIVTRGASVEDVKEKLQALGLDPNARTSILPAPPPRREELFATIVTSAEDMAEALATAKAKVAARGQPSPYAIVRGRAR